jgi:hypothetical protein
MISGVGLALRVTGGKVIKAIELLVFSFESWEVLVVPEFGEVQLIKDALELS